MKKKLFILFLTIFMFLGVSLAALYFINVYNDTRDNNLTTGLVSIDFLEGEEEINLENTTPVIDDIGITNTPYTFTIKNTSKVPINVNIKMIPNSNNTLPIEAIRYAFYVNDELINKNNIVLNSDNTFYTYNNLKVGETVNCKLIFWVDYYYEEPNKTFSASIKVEGENFDGLYEKPTSETLKEKVVSYSVANNSSFTGGLVAINTEGTLYNETDTQEEIREYRYSGLNVNNYVFLDNNGDGVKDANEIWRIVGIFKNSDDEWNLKLMRNTVLQADEIPVTYTYNGTNYSLKDSNTTNQVYWNKTNTATNYSDWTTAKLGYFLNASDGYFGTLSNGIRSIIDINYEYYLGNVSLNYTTISAYTNERLKSNIYSENQSTWNGKVGLLYPSDYGYSARSTYWNETILNSYGSNAYATSWMYVNANHTASEWFFAPSASGSNNVTYWYASGGVYDSRTFYNSFVARPVINLNSGTKLDINHQGTNGDPYLIA